MKTSFLMDGLAFTLDLVPLRGQRACYAEALREAAIREALSLVRGSYPQARDALGDARCVKLLESMGRVIEAQDTATAWILFSDFSLGRNMGLGKALLESATRVLRALEGEE